MNYYDWGPTAADHHQDHKISTLKHDTAGISGEIRALKSQVDRLTIATQAMWELLRDAGYGDEEALAAKISEVDLRDGVADGKLGSTVIKCGSCGRNTNTRRASCVWCGEETEREHIFEG